MFQVRSLVPEPFCYAGVVQLDRTLRYERRDVEVRILPPAPFSACRSTGQGTSLRRMRSGFESRRADQAGYVIVVESGWIGDALACPRYSWVRRFTDTHLRGGDRLVRYSAVYGADAGSIPSLPAIPG